MHWQTQHFILAGITAALTFAMAFLLGSGIIAATGIPATGGLANIFVAVLVVVIGSQIARVPGFATLTITLVFLLATPTIIGGPPGLYKILNGFLIGLSFDIIVWLGAYKHWSYVLGGAVGAMVSLVSIYLAMLALGLPSVERLQPLVIPLAIAQGILGALGGALGLLVFHRRLKHLGAVKRLMNSPH